MAQHSPPHPAPYESGVGTSTRLSGLAPARLPVIRTSFVGRKAELAKVVELLRTEALVTLTGPGGSGKTRLAVEAARRRPEVLADPPVWVDLSGLASPELVEASVATAFGLRGRAGVDVVDDIASSISDRRRLLLFDNCEHVVEAAAALCEALIARCEGLRILATSRIPLRIPGESVVAVPPLGLKEEAVQLFADRAQAASSAFSIGPANKADVREICRRLDAIPLAIELAAPWTTVMPPSELLPLLDRRFEVLESGHRTASARQRTLRSAIDWSHALLLPEEQVLFRRLSAFSGTFTREAAERVCGDDALPPERFLRLLGSLCGASMVVAETPSTGVGNYRLLESLRAYGAEQLVEAGERDRFLDRHLAYYTELAREAFEQRMNGGNRSAIELLEPERDNIRAALDWGADRDPERALTLIGALVEDVRHSLLTTDEMRRRLEPLLRRTATGTAPSAWALIAMGYTAFIAADDHEAIRLFSQSIQVFRGRGDRTGEAWARVALGHAKWALGDVPGCTAEFRRSEAIFDDLGNRLGSHRARLRAAIAESLEPSMQARVRRELEQAVHDAPELGDPFGAGMSHNWLGMVDLTNGAVDSAWSHFLAAIPLLENDSVVAVSFFGLAACCLEGDPERSLRLIGAGEALQPRRGLAKPQLLARVIDEYRPRAAAKVSEEVARRAYEEGYALSQSEAIALALSREKLSKGRSRLAPSGLTRREAEVAALVAEGHTNREIAEVLFLSVRTVETHVDRILTKLGFHNRTRIASWVREQQAKST